jgi:RNA polymerase sigma-70 factor (ECF subfamily)
MNPIDQALERVLVLRCQTGDARALEDLYRRYQRPLGYYLRRLLDDDEQAAADAQQEVWLTVYRRVRGLRAPEAFAVWLYRIAHSRAVNRLGRRRFEASSLDDPDVGAVAADDSTEADRFSPEDAADIHRALGALRPEHREVLVLRFMEDLSYEQIADVTGCNLGTVRSRLHYAKAALRRELEKSHARTH